ncbi:amidohydrolase [Alkalilimnicola ehrlichii]|uniref:Amidohydrolase n=1 Tax=Alkalilimnicola ehrlichii TaxID=351052 RepID=A0A3E0WIM6_9GAMM|nr:amidohydrolase [Alkalilimnicola ehrlichii]RFA32073.1 amidohydrolase [Alkalilimnicola ehrlichii]
MNVASAQYPVDFLGDWQQFENKLSAWVSEAADNGAELLIFPEYGSMELASLFASDIYSSLQGQLNALQELLTPYIQLHQRLAQKHALYILASSFPVRVETNEFRNRAYLLAPDASVQFQEKLHMTRFENEQWGISAGTRIKVIDTHFGRIGINICYDSEFPLIARTQVEAGAELILVPSCTDTLAGYHRVRIGSQARALENQCHVVQSCLVGEAPWSQAVDINVGASAIYTPVDSGFPGNGVLACGDYNAPSWVYGRVELKRARGVRANGQVFNFRDWPRQYAFVDAVEHVSLTENAKKREEEHVLSQKLSVPSIS